MQLWQPSIRKEEWVLRLDLVQRTRSFFASRNALEVETPSLSQAIGTDPHLDYFSTREFVDASHDEGQELFLMTSPEFHMKRLLAAGYGDIWQLCKAFRPAENGHKHNPEFSMLEWYRVEWDWNQLMEEVRELFQSLAAKKSSATAALIQQPWKTISWQQAYLRYTGLDPLTAAIPQYQAVALEHNLPALPHQSSFEEWQDYFMATLIEDQLGYDAPTFLTHYPAAQASLAQLDKDDPRFARRFELYIQGIELCNGYQELTQAQEQEQRFAQDLSLRQKVGKRLPPIDHHFLQALQHGLPACSGVAVGFDRLVMLLLNQDSIDQTILFPRNRC